ncbi:unnamed protein product [Rhizoctonia solani]|nr:unnamed protein product [Rhizoctonia solani]
MAEIFIPDSDAWETMTEPQTPEQDAESEPNMLPKRSALKLPKNKQVITILLVGETGSGKTSFVSLLLNLLQGKGPFELEELHFPGAESGLDKTQSQTSNAKLYIYDTTDGVKFQIIDTPGLADTRGIEENTKHKEKIYNAIKNLVTRIDGIMLVANGRNERVSASTNFTLQTLATLFPRAIKENIGILLTNVAPDGYGRNFQMSCLPADLQEAGCWCIENPLSTLKNYWDQIKDLTELERQNSRQGRRLVDDYEDTVKCLDKWLEWLGAREALPTTAIIELYHKSAEIESRLSETTLSLENLSRLRKRLQGLIRDVKAANKHEASIAEVLSGEPTVLWKLVETSQYNTICFTPGCHSNCHIQCTLELSEPQELGGWCKVFKTLGVPNRLMPLWSDSAVKCSKCKHEASEHRNHKRLYQEGPNPIFAQAVQKLHDAKTSAENLRGATSRIEKDIKQIEQNIEKSKLEILRLVEQINNISLSPNYAGYIRSAIQLLEIRKKSLESQPDSDRELSIINEAIMAFEAHLILLRDAAKTQVVAVSSGLVLRGRFKGPTRW